MVEDNFVPAEEDFLFVPLGGVGRIGMNVSLYHYKGKWLMIDLGAGFAEDDMPGVDILIPDIRFIESRKSDLVGIVVTHCHEDHVGAIPYWIQKLKCYDGYGSEERFPTIYTTRFSANFINLKLVEYGLKDAVPIEIIDVDATLQLDVFKLDFVRMTHSVLENVSVLVTTDAGKCFHTGDWKMDPDPIMGPTCDFEKLERIGNMGIDAMVCDSTNVCNEGTSGSEGSLREPIFNIINEAKGKVFVSLFASNVPRIKLIYDAAERAGRKVVVAGTSLKRILTASRESGYLEECEFLTENDVSMYSRDKLLVMCTGCQGEELAVTAKLANDQHRCMKAVAGDTIMFSSKIIPGNEKRITGLFNKFYCKQVEVITESTHEVHVSGHPYQEEVKRMYGFINPKLSIPVHGEHIHLYTHCDLASGHCEVGKYIVPDDGMVIRLSGVQEPIGKVNSGHFGVDGRMLHSPDGNVMEIRRRISGDGLVVIVLMMDSHGSMVSAPVVLCPGLLDVTNRLHREFIKHIQSRVESAVSDKMSDMNCSEGGGSRRDKGGGSSRFNIPRSDIRNAVKRVVRSIISYKINKNPQIEVQVEVVRY